MKTLISTLATAYILLIPVSSVAVETDKTLSFEVTPYKHTKIYCENDDNIKPSKNDFELLDYTALSSEQGDRFVLVTIKNTSSGQRLFNQSSVVAILSDCTRIRPLNIELTFSGNEVLTKQLNFGINKYPILKLIN